jgi:hypothetical protein
MNNNPIGVQAALAALLERSQGYGEPVSHVIYQALTHGGHTMAEMVRLKDSELIDVLYRYRDFRNAHPSRAAGQEGDGRG